MAWRSDKSLHPVDIHVGQRIEKRREEIGMKLEDLAATSALSVGEIDRIERGVLKATSYELFNISHALNVTINFFFEKYEDSLNKETLRLIKAFMNISSSSEREKCIRFIEGKTRSNDDTSG